jgi:hypothetical protein
MLFQNCVGCLLPGDVASSGLDCSNQLWFSAVSSLWRVRVRRV